MKKILIIFLLFLNFSGYTQIIRTLSNVNNTADTSKPLSNAQKAVVIQKLHTVTSISALQAYTDASVALFDGSTWNKKSGNFTSNGSSSAGTIIRVDASNYWERKYETVNLKWFIKADGTTDDTQGWQNASALGKALYFEKGTSIINGKVELLNNVTFEKDAIVKVKDSYAGDVFYIQSKKNIILNNIYIDASGNSINCNGLKIEGLWNSTINNFGFFAKSTDANSVGINILSSNHSVLDNFGAYCIDINNPYIQYGKSGVYARKSSFDNIASNTHINIEGGWIANQLGTSIDLADTYDFYLRNIAFDVIPFEAVRLNNCSKGRLIVGEYNSGLLLNVNDNCSNILVETVQSIDFSTAITGTNYQVKSASKLRLKPAVDNAYWTEIRSNYSYGNPFEIYGRFAGGEQQILSYQIDAGLKPITLSPSLSGNNPIALNPSGGIVKQTYKTYEAGSAPTTGTWAVGDFVKNSAPTAGGYFGWVCITAGTPGVWKGFGLIQN